MRIIPIYGENSFLLGHVQLNTRGVTFIEKTEGLCFLPIGNEFGKLAAFRVAKEEDFKTNNFETVFDKGFGKGGKQHE